MEESSWEPRGAGRALCTKSWLPALEIRVMGSQGMPDPDWDHPWRENRWWVKRREWHLLASLTPEVQAQTPMEAGGTRVCFGMFLHLKGAHARTWPFQQRKGQNGQNSPQNWKAPPLCRTCWSEVDIQPQRYIQAGRQEYLRTEAAPSSFNNRKKYRDVDKSTHPVKFFSFPLGSFFSPRCCCFLN